MVVLQSAASIAEVAHANRQIFIKEVLEGPVFKKMVRVIEEAALTGKKQCSFEVFSAESIEVSEVLVDTLHSAGYKTKLLNNGNITITWGKEDKK